MYSQYKDEHLSRIETMWSVLFAKPRTPESSINNAQGLLLQRYCGAVYRYLVKVVGNVSEAEELAQEFAVKMLQGSFKTADRSKGRFRDYVKTSLFNLVRKHKGKKRPGLLSEDAPEPAIDDPQDAQTFTDNWREELLAKTWESLAHDEQQTGKPFFTYLQYRTQHNTTSRDMAIEFSKRFNKPLTADGVRKTVERARERFGELLIEEVARSIQSQKKDLVEQELADLGLLAYCQDALERWKSQ